MLYIDFEIFITVVVIIYRNPFNLLNIAMFPIPTKLDHVTHVYYHVYYRRFIVHGGPSVSEARILQQFVCVEKEIVKNKPFVGFGWQGQYLFC